MVFGKDGGHCNGEWAGIMNGDKVCQFDDDNYDVVKTDYGFEVNKVV